MSRRGLVVWFTLVLVGAIASRFTLPGLRAGRCRLDGVRLTPIYRVDLLRDGVVQASFCSVRCAAEWPEVPPGSYWQVRDEITGVALDATRACFVESDIVTVPSRQDRTHVFASWADAMAHADEYHGRRITNPLVTEPAPAPGAASADSSEHRDED